MAGHGKTFLVGLSRAWSRTAATVQKNRSVVTVEMRSLSSGELPFAVAIFDTNPSKQFLLLPIRTLMTTNHLVGRSIEAAIWADHAIVDRESGRVLWEGGASNTLWESVGPKLGAAEYLAATLCSFVLSVAFLGILVTWWIQPWMVALSSTTTSGNKMSRIVWTLLWPLWKIPRVENRWLVLTFVVLYLWESCNCSTRRFLSHTISSSEQLEEYLEQLRQAPPVVTWTLKTFHYEYRRIVLLPRLLLRSIIRSATVLPEEKDLSTLDYTMKQSSRHTSAKPFLTKKVVTHQASAMYQFVSCQDETMVGVWERAQTLDGTAGAPLTKVALTQLLILKDGKSRDDYLKQQSDFVSINGNADEFSQFSTDFHVASVQPRILVVRRRHPAFKLFQIRYFWLFTILGLTVPYRIWFDNHADFVRVITIKETSVSPETQGKWTTAARSIFPMPPASSVPIKHTVGSAIFGE
jgi:hypothetical protein